MPLTASEYCYLVGFLAGCVIRRVFARPRRDGSIAAGRRTVPDVATVALSAVGMFVLPLLHLTTDWFGAANLSLPPALRPATSVAGSGVFALALLLLWRSHADLGHAWSVFPQVRTGQGLVTSGVYSRIRHPMYAAHVLWALAQALLLHNWVVGPSMLVTLIPFYLLRVGQEEGLLREHFGEQYEAYARRTGRILPRLRKPG